MKSGEMDHVMDLRSWSYFEFRMAGTWVEALQQRMPFSSIEACEAAAKSELVEALMNSASAFIKASDAKWDQTHLHDWRE
jgi:hypothetical protein